MAMGVLLLESLLQAREKTFALQRADSKLLCHSEEPKATKNLVLRVLNYLSTIGRDSSASLQNDTKKQSLTL